MSQLIVDPHDDPHLPRRRRHDVAPSDPQSAPPVLVPTSAIVRDGHGAPRPVITVDPLTLADDTTVAEAMFVCARTALQTVGDAHPWVGRPAADCLRAVEWSSRNGQVSRWHWDRNVPIAGRVVSAVWKQLSRRTDGVAHGDANTERVVRVVNQIVAAGRSHLDDNDEAARRNLRAALANIA